MLLTEPLAAFLLSRGASSSSCGWLSPSPGSASVWEWLGAGIRLRGYSPWSGRSTCWLALGLPVLWLAREALRGRAPRRRPSPRVISLLATCLVLAPWTIRNAVELGRFVPVSTGGGKALFIGTYLDAGGDAVEAARNAARRTARPAPAARRRMSGTTTPTATCSSASSAASPPRATPAWKPTRRSGRLGRQGLEDDITDEPLRFAGMLATKSYETWTDAGARSVMLKEPSRALQLALGRSSPSPALAILGLRGVASRPWWASLVFLYNDRGRRAADRLARRELVVLPLLAALAGTAIIEAPPDSVKVVLHLKGRA